MRYLIVLLLTGVVSGNIVASAQTYGHFDTPSTNGVFARFQFPTEMNAIRSDTIVRYSLLSNSTNMVGVFIPKPEYFCRLRLFDSQTNEIAKSRLGLAMGAEFTALKTFSHDQIMLGGRDTGGGRQLSFVVVVDDTAVARELPPVEQMFRVARPGRYRLQIEMQVFARRSDAKGPYVLSRMPMVEVPVIKGQ